MKKILLTSLLVSGVFLSSHQVKADNVLTKVQSEISTIKTNKTNKEKEVTSDKTKFDKLTQEKTNLEKELEKLKNIQANQNKEHSAIKKEIDNLKVDKAKEEVSVEDYENSIKKRKTELAKSWNLVKVTEAKDLDEAVEALGEIFSNKDTKLDKLKENLAKEKEDLKEVKTKLKNKEKKNSELDADLVNSSSALKTKEKELKEKETEAKDANVVLVNHTKELDKLKTELAEKEAKEKDIKANLYKYALNNNETNFNDIEDKALLERTIGQTRKNTGAKEHTEQIATFLAIKFGVSDYGTFRGDSDGQGTGHGDGLAVDLMVNKAKGDEISKYLINNMNELGISYIIWEQKFYSLTNNIYGAGGTWGAMPDRGSATQNHFDHIHISFSK